MNKTWKRVVVFLFFLFPVYLGSPSSARAQAVCPSLDQDPCARFAGNDPAKSECYQSVSNACQSQKNTLTSQISYMNSQMQLTTIQIAGTQTKIKTLSDEITKLGTEVQKLEAILNSRIALLLKRIPLSYKRSSTPEFATLFFSKDFFDFLTRIKYVRTVQQQDAALVFRVKATQNSYNESKATREGKKTQLEEVKEQLVQQNNLLIKQKLAKDTLLSQTKGQEATYQQLLAQAKAQLAGFASFADSQGATLLTGQTYCDSWGCYYSQRDSQWGNAIINGQSSGCSGPCSVLRVGCLITSISMIANHYGHKDIMPSDIAFSSPANFSVGTAMLVKGTIYVKGKSIHRTTIASKLNPDLLTNGPVIVGVYHGPFGTHFVVIKSCTDGKYMMNDPYMEGGHDKVFTEHYSLDKVFAVDRVTM